MKAHAYQISDSERPSHQRELLPGEDSLDSLLQRHQALSDLHARLSRHHDVDDLRDAVAASLRWIEQLLRKRAGVDHAYVHDRFRARPQSSRWSRVRHAT